MREPAAGVLVDELPTGLLAAGDHLVTRVIDDTASLGHRFQCLVWNMVTTVSFVSLDFAIDHQELNVMEAFQFNNKGDPYIEA